MHVSGMDCCGGFELVGINDKEWTAKEYLLKYIDESSLMSHNRGKGFVVFSYAYDVGKVAGKEAVSKMRTYAQMRRRIKAWTDFIRNNNLGTVHVGKAAYNPNYGKTIKLVSGLWIPNNAGIKKMMQVTGWRGEKVVHSGLEWNSDLDTIVGL